MSVNPASLYELFERTAKQFPEKEAISHSDDRYALYGWLSEGVNQIADYLTRNGLVPKQRVLLMDDKSITTICHLLAVLKCGCAVVPFDPTISSERLDFLVQDLQPQLILFREDWPHLPVVPHKGYTQLYEFDYGYLGYFLAQTEAHKDDLAYILFTSGSTGKPKGVTLTHANILAFIYWAQDTFNFSSDELFAGIAPLYFDLSLLDLFGAFVCGGSVVLYGQNEVSNARFLAQHIAQRGITNLYTTPSTLRLLQQFGGAAKQQYPHIKRVLFAGEVFEPKALHQWMQQLPQARFYNLYGPTESNVCTWYEIERPVDDTRTQPYPIGKACTGMELRINESNGELLIAGPQLSPGYWNRDALNSEKFSEADGKTWYHSGDRVRLENGNYVYEGRTDRMLKKRGYRVEPEQIEHVLLQSEHVHEAAVIGGTDTDGYAFLAAFIALNTPAGEMLLTLKNHCAAHLPHYMIPERIIFMAQLPKTGSGKIDYQALKQQL
ncbi:MAG: amino acid adenylation domain-containing protein [Bacteroidetes bacterium]|nr:amino acid adenylation domain-containing protein [Bacteroidota bacterium]